MTIDTLSERREQARNVRTSKLEIFLSKQENIRVELAKRHKLQQERETERLKIQAQTLLVNQLLAEAEAEREVVHQKAIAAERERLLEVGRVKSEEKLLESKAREQAALERRASVLSDESMRQSIRMRKRAQRQR